MGGCHPLDPRVMCRASKAWISTWRWEAFLWVMNRSHPLHRTQENIRARHHFKAGPSKQPDGRHSQPMEVVRILVCNSHFFPLPNLFILSSKESIKFWRDGIYEIGCGRSTSSWVKKHQKPVFKAWRALWGALFTLELEGPWRLKSKISRWWKVSRLSHFTFH